MGVIRYHSTVLANVHRQSVRFVGLFGIVGTTVGAQASDEAADEAADDGRVPAIHSEPEPSGTVESRSPEPSRLEASASPSESPQDSEPISSAKRSDEVEVAEDVPHSGKERVEEPLQNREVDGESSDYRQGESESERDSDSDSNDIPGGASRQEDGTSAARRNPPTSSSLPAHGEASTTDEETPESQVRAFLVPKVGFAVGGTTRARVDCSTDGEITCEPLENENFVESSGVVVALEGLYGIGENFGLGAILHWVPSAQGRASGSRFGYGMEFALRGVGEVSLEVAEDLSVLARLSGGMALLAPRGHAQDLIDEGDEDCDAAAAAGASCTFQETGHFAPTLGAGVGLRWKTPSNRGLRVELEYLTQEFELYRQDVESPQGSIEGAVVLDQSRFWLAVGLEI